MDECITAFEDSDWRDGRGDEPQAIGDILAQLLAQYEAKFPHVNITVVEVPAAA
jgi:hypothetical protein